MITCGTFLATASAGVGRRAPALASTSVSASAIAKQQRHAAWQRQQQTRWHSHAASTPDKPLASDAYTSPFAPRSSATSQVTSQEATHGTPAGLRPGDRHALESMLRVDHAGEVAANTIYRAQASVFGALGDSRTKQMMLDMWDSEKKHLAVAEKLLAQHRTRPSALLPLWSLAGTVLGASTALMGKEAAMACTEAVETVIGEHYDE